MYLSNSTNKKYWNFTWNTPIVVVVGVEDKSLSRPHQYLNSKLGCCSSCCPTSTRWPPLPSPRPPPPTARQTGRTSAGSVVKDTPDHPPSRLTWGRTAVNDLTGQLRSSLLVLCITGRHIITEWKDSFNSSLWLWFRMSSFININFKTSKTSSLLTPL